MDTKNDLADTLLEAMARLGMNQAELSRKSGVSKQTVSDYINRKRIKPDPEALALIAHALKLPIEVVYSAANIPLTPMIPAEAKLFELQYIYANATEQQKEDIVRYARYIATEYRPSPPAKEPPPKSASKTNPITKPKPHPSEGSA